MKNDDYRSGMLEGVARCLQIVKNALEAAATESGVNASAIMLIMAEEMMRCYDALKEEKNELG